MNKIYQKNKPFNTSTPQVTGNPMNLRESFHTTIVSFVIRFFPLPWRSINNLIFGIKFQVTLSSLCHVTCKYCKFQETKVTISMTSLLILSICLVMLCLLKYFLDHLWMTSILFDVKIYCIFFSISKLVNWISVTLWYI